MGRCGRAPRSSLPLAWLLLAAAFFPGTLALRMRPSVPRFESPALDAVELAVDAALSSAAGRSIDSLDSTERESVAVARRLRKRFDAFARNGDCRRCWLQVAHCVCDRVEALGDAGAARNLYVVMHHKEVLLAVDTAKLLLAAYPGHAHLIVGGLAGQPAEAAMRRALEAREAAVLFPTDDAVSVSDFASRGTVDVVVIDGTWSQARKLYRRLPRSDTVSLDDDTVSLLATGQGRQLRSHPTKWREVSTLSATRHLLNGLGAPTAHRLAEYQDVADAAARRQLGPPRLRAQP